MHNDNTIPLPDSKIEFSEGEVLVRKYFITYSGWPKSRGDVAVTNKRVIYQGKGGSSTSVNEVPIETVTAINTYYGKGFRVIFILLALAALWMLISSFSNFSGWSILWLILFVVFALLSYNTGYSLNIMSSGAAGSPISVGRSDIVLNKAGILKQIFLATTGQGAAFSINADPTAEAIQMMHEIGAIVLDMKIMGDRAVAKWQNFQSKPVPTKEVPKSWRSMISPPNMSQVAGAFQGAIQGAAQGAQQQPPAPGAPGPYPQQQVPGAPGAFQQAPGGYPQQPPPPAGGFQQPPPPPGAYQQQPPQQPPQQGGGNGGYFG